MLRDVTILSLLLAGRAFEQQPVRLIVQGKNVSSTEQPGENLRLRGFAFWFEDTPDGSQLNVTAEDRSVGTLLPKTNLARLVMAHWHDSSSAKDCATEDPDTGYLTPSCLSMFDKAVAWAAGEQKMWVVITARAANAAGDGGQNHTVFTNTTLANQMKSMWQFLAKRYASVDRIAGYEVMSEPRSKNDGDVVHQFQQSACTVVWSEDPRAVCFVGPAEFYDRHHLGPAYLIKGSPQVIYAANFFVPKNWVTAKTPAAHAIAYGDTAPCCTLAKKDACGNQCNTNITFDKSWLESQLSSIDEFQRNYSVPIWIDQWGAYEAVGGGPSSQLRYLTDVLELFEQRGLHWAYWWWKDSFGEKHCVKFPGAEHGYGYAVTCKLGNGTVHHNEGALAALGKYIGHRH